MLELRRTAEQALTAVIHLHPQDACIQGVSTRSVAALVQAMGGTGVSKSEVSRLCGEIDERVGAVLDRPIEDRPIEGEWPSLGLDAPCVKARRDGRVASVAVIVAVAVTTHGRRDARQAGGAGRDGRQLGSGPLGDRVPALLEPPWAARRQAGDLRRPRGKAAASRGLGATAQRGRVHVLRNAMQHAGRTQRRIVSAWIGTAFAEADQASARQQACRADGRGRG